MEVNVNKGGKVYGLDLTVFFAGHDLVVARDLN